MATAGVMVVSKTASVLFTDMVNSTQQWQRLGDEAAIELQRWHDELVAGAIDGASGQIVKGLGDGVMATFDAASGAVEAAVRIQRSVTAAADDPRRRIEVRIGISVGDVELVGDDCFGTTVIEAARLCSAAEGGQILVADLVVALCRNRGTHTFDSVGAIELRGLEEPVAASTVAWAQPLAPDEGVAFPDLEHEPLARSVVDAIEPYRHMNGNVTHFTLGPVAVHWMTALAAAGDPDRAAHEIDDVLARVRDHGPAFEPFASAQAIRVLLRRGTGADIERARAIADRAASVATQFGMSSWPPALDSLFASTTGHG